MLPYILYILMTLILSIRYDGKAETRGKKVWYIITCLFLIMLAGLRNGVGGDTQAYMDNFEYVPYMQQEYSSYILDNFQIRSYMPSWSILNLLCKRWFDSFYAVQLIEALLVNTCIFYLFKQYTSRIFMCALLFGISGYFFIFNTEVMREAFAVALTGIGMYQYMRGNKTIFYVLILIGLTFHISALIALAFPLTRLKKISLNTCLLAFGLSFVLWIGNNLIMNIFMGHVFGTMVVFQKLLHYGDMQNNLFGFLESALRYLVSLTGIFYFAQFSPERTDKMQSDYAQYVGFYLLLAIVICAIPGFYRLLNYTAIMTIILVADFIGSWKSQLTNMAFSKTIILLIFFFYIGKYYYRIWPEAERHHYEFFVPYTSIMDENPDIDYRYYMWSSAVVHESTEKNSRSYK